jgi:hypothetical protein
MAELCCAEFMVSLLHLHCIGIVEVATCLVAQPQVHVIPQELEAELVLLLQQYHNT